MKADASLGDAQLESASQTMKVLILLVCVGGAFAGYHGCGFRLSQHRQWVTGDWSAKLVDDSESRAVCPRGYEMVSCTCERWPNRPDSDCDGAWIEQYDDDRGTTCVAYNSATGHGVHAKAFCLPMVITCSTPYDNQPRTKCPNNYKLTGCTYHAHYMHNLWINQETKRKHPRGTRGGYWNPNSKSRITKAGVCGVERGCKDCKVQARCVRVGQLDR